MFAPNWRARIGAGELSILEDWYKLDIFSKHLCHWILRLQALGVIAVGMKHIQFHMRHVWCTVWHNTCVTGDSADRNLATAIGRADS